MEKLGAAPTVVRHLRVDCRDLCGCLEIVVSIIKVIAVAEVALLIEKPVSGHGSGYILEADCVSEILKSLCRLGKVNTSESILLAFLVEHTEIDSLLRIERPGHSATACVRLPGVRFRIHDLEAVVGLTAHSPCEIDGCLAVRRELPDVVAVDDQHGVLVLVPFRGELVRRRGGRMIVLLIVERNSGPGGKVDLLTCLGIVGEPVHLVVVEPDKVLPARRHVETSDVKPLRDNLPGTVLDIHKGEVVTVVIVPDSGAGILSVIAGKHPFGESTVHQADAGELRGGQRHDPSRLGEIDGG